MGLLFTKVAVFREYLWVRSTPTGTIRAAAVGRTDVEGEGRTVDDPVRWPTDGKCLFAVWQISERSGDGWDTTYTGMDGGRFLVSDGTGNIPVENPERRFPQDTPETEYTPSVIERTASGAAIENRTEYRVRYATEDDRGETHEAVVTSPTKTSAKPRCRRAKTCPTDSGQCVSETGSTRSSPATGASWNWCSPKRKRCTYTARQCGPRWLLTPIRPCSCGATSAKPVPARRPGPGSVRRRPPVAVEDERHRRHHRLRTGASRVARRPGSGVMSQFACPARNET